MAKKDYTVSFRNAVIDLESDTITEINNNSTEEYSLSEVLAELEGKSLNITFKETKPLPPRMEEDR